MKICILSLCLLLLVCCSPQSNKIDMPTNDAIEDSISIGNNEAYVQRLDTLELIVLYPKYSSIDLVCGNMPSKKDSSVVLFAEAAYTGELLKEFKHTNIAGDHVSSGKRYKGYRCKRNSAAFVYYNREWKFCYKEYSKDMEEAAINGGCAFAQELIIRNGKAVESVRKDNNVNQFRTLCNHNGSLCIIESYDIISFGYFKKKLLDYGIYDAIYLDMGAGWNHAWYRDNGNVVELHPKVHNYCTNWITFYK